MKRTLVMVGFAAVLTCSLAASAAPTPELRARIVVMLGAPEYTPTEAEWKALGPDAVEVLRDIALDPKVLVLKRGRAASALGYFKTDMARVALTRLVTDDRAAWLLRGKAAHALAHAYGPESLPLLEPLLASEHRRLREVTVRAVASVPSVASRQLLVRRLPQEKDAHVRAVIGEAVADLDRKVAKQ